MAHLSAGGVFPSLICTRICGGGFLISMPARLACLASSTNTLNKPALISSGLI